MDTHLLSTLLLLAILGVTAINSEEDTETVFCLDHQKAFEGSCYEFVTLQRSSLEAQRWCERGGGHLAFIQNDETQQFLQKHLQSEQDWWLGLAPASFNLSMGSAATEGSLSWLDGSDVSYSNWLREPELGDACGYIVKKSGFQWASTQNCSQEFHFICEFESGHALACLEHNATLQCGSGQVIEIDDSFYGRKTLHYCRTGRSPPDSSLQEECSWVDVVDMVSEHCLGLQVCQAVADVASFGEPCPGLGSYLSVDYHCKDGLHLLITKQAAVFDNVTLTIKWLLHPFQGNLTCSVNTGDGHTIDPYMPEELQSNVVHRYQDAGVYTVTVECSTSEWHVAAQKTVTIQEPAGEFSKIVCYSSNQTTDSENCKGLKQHALRIQVQLSSGTNVTYKIQHGITELVRSPEVRGIIPHNLTIPEEASQLLGLGCHQLTLLASNRVTAPDVSTPLELCLVEPVDGLQASVAPEQDLCSDSALYVNVSLDRGAPVEVLFLVSGDNDSFSETHNMLNGSVQMFRVFSKIEGQMRVKVRVSNLFSSAEADAGDTLLDCQTEDLGEINGNNLTITANPENPVIGTSSIMLDVNGLNRNAKLYTFAWNCSGTCPCDVSSPTKTHQVQATCLPPPYSFSIYSMTAVKTTGKPEEQTASKCISVFPGSDLNPVITCSNCNPVNVGANVELQLECEGCQQMVWYIEDTNPVPDALSSCYSEKGQSVLIKQKEGVSSFVIDSATLVNAQQDIKVVAYGVRDGLSGSAEFTIPIFGASSTLFPTLLPDSVATNGQEMSPPPSCNINPTVGDSLSPFNITCTVASPFCKAGPCMYCFRTLTGDYLYCGHNQTVESLFLPVGSNINNTLAVSITVENLEGQKINTTLSVQVNDASVGPTVEDLQSFVSKQVDQLLQLRKLTGAALAQMFQSVSNRLNEDTTEGQEQDAKMKLREQMLLDLGTAMSAAPLRNPLEVQKTADAVVGLTRQSKELTSTAQLEASSLLSNLSMSLVSLTLSEGDDKEVTRQVVTPIIQAASNILKASASTDQQEIISENLLTAADNVQSALLAGVSVDQEPIIVSTSEISVYVNRMSAVALQKQPFSIEHNSSASFVLPSLGPNVLPSEEPVDVRMLSFAINPFPWRDGEPINGAVASLSITRKNGSVIPVSNLTEEIEIILPRQEAEVNSTLLDLGNYSTLVINVTTPNISLVLKLDPSEEILLHLLLGFEHYPNNTHYKTTIQLPQPGNSTEERYAWVLDPKDVALEVGVYYLLVRPISQAGVNSSNASVFITSIAAQCKYWDETETNWSDHGCRVGPRTTPLITQCLCTHLTFFGSSFFVMPNLVDVSRTAELFATFVNNPVVVCFVGAIFLVYLMVVIWARRKDIQDTAKVKVTLLEDNDPLAEYRYLLTINTGHRRGASTSSQVTVTLMGSEGESEPHHLTDPDKPVFERGGVDMFLLTTPFSLGELQSIRLWHDNSGKHPAWYVNKVMVQDLETGQKWHFLCSSWLAIDVGECTLDKVFPVATEMDLKRFSNLFFMKTTKDFQDGHIWFSVINRPPNSNFTRVQRVSCCFSLLLCTMLTSIMFWGIPTDPSEQTMDLGKIEFTWQQVMIGFQSSIIMFPINLLIVSIFRNVRPRERRTVQAPKQSKTDSVKQGKTGRVSPNQPPSPPSDYKEITPHAVIRDIKRIAQSLSKAMRSPLPRIDPEKMDINDLLSLVEDIICQQNRIGGEFYSDASKKELSISLGAVNLHERSPEQMPKEKNSIYRQYLYKQLQNVEKELRLLGPSRFSKPESYVQAVLQVQGMKRLLEPYLSSSTNRDQDSCSSSLGKDHDGGKKCCQKGLPWWFVFVAWILVAATSGVSAYFTMMYGLTYGMERSVSWLISMLVSFFESLFITQPIKVLGFAVFFALVLKKVDQEEYSDVPIEGAISSTDDPDGICIVRRDSTCSFYQPPPPSDIEKMKSNMIKEQKVFALIREILIYFGFLWMLLLVAYGQRDPNAYYLTQHIQQSFRNGITDSMNCKDVLTWTNTTLLNNVFGKRPGFITDGNSKLVGNARLRQVRVHKNSCRTSSFMSRSIQDCHAPYSWEVEDMGSYGPGWNRSNDVNLSKSLLMPWRYQTQSRLRTHPIWGRVAFYRGGGFVVDLGPNKENASSLLQYLFDNIWVDKYTRAIFVELTVYNANVNLFCMVTLMFETTAVGAFQYRSDLQSVRLYQSAGGFHIFMMASETIYFLFILHYMFQQGKLMKQHKWEYFRSKWNVLELGIIILSWSALCVFIKRKLLGNQDIEYYQNHKDQHASFYETATADGVLGYLIAFLVLLATVKLWHLLRLNPKLQMITATLRRAWNDISGFIIVMTIMLLAYSIACNLMYGWKLYSYHTLLHAAKTIVSLQLGIFNYEEVLHYNPVLGAFVIGSCIIFMTFVVLNLFISVILVAFSEEQLHHKPSEEEEIVDLMLMKICSLLGIKVKKKQVLEEPKAAPFTVS
ncbi:polycystic kidney disease protein 1-like 2 [Clarias gariepinus]|uniref:polycystic kidney disease protein 1-like 2 n=1 Tax=Clarias gariepinus TaxID=13013 RepID=UPI00234CF041|nr:polycystic kidney disease protein 1-like 2 [Clarias gariepinus]